MTTKTMHQETAPRRGSRLAAAGRVDTKKLAAMAMLVALAYVVTAMTRLPLVGAAPYLKYDPKDVVLVIGGFLYGPMAAAGMSIVTCLIEMFTVSESGFIGFVMNVLASWAFVCPAAFLYQKRRTIRGAVAGLTCGVVLMTATMLLWNFLITPLYQDLTREAVTEMLIPIFLPFNALKAGLNMALAILLYQPINNALRRAHLLPALPDGQTRRKINLGNLLFGAVLLGVCILLVEVALGNL